MKRSFIGRMALGAFLVSLIPYSVQTDEKTGTVEIRSLLWAWRKTPPKEGEEKGSYAFAIPPSSLDHIEAEDEGDEGDEQEPDKEEAVTL